MGDGSFEVSCSYCTTIRELGTMSLDNFTEEPVKQSPPKKKRKPKKQRVKKKRKRNKAKRLPEIVRILYYIPKIKSKIIKDLKSKGFKLEKEKDVYYLKRKSKKFPRYRRIIILKKIDKVEGKGYVCTDCKQFHSYTSQLGMQHYIYREVFEKPKKYHCQLCNVKHQTKSDKGKEHWKYREGKEMPKKFYCKKCKINHNYSSDLGDKHLKYRDKEPNEKYFCGNCQIEHKRNTDIGKRHKKHEIKI